MGSCTEKPSIWIILCVLNFNISGRRQWQLMSALTSGPFCQISTIPNPLPQGLREPPAYVPPVPSSSNEPPSYNEDLLPTYSSLSTPHNHHPPTDEKASSSSAQPAEDVLHFLNHEIDTLASLSLRYKVPISALRRANGITSDHLLLARRTILIPGEYYKGGVSLSPRPVEGEEEEIRRGKVRRWMVACKVAEYVILSNSHSNDFLFYWAI